MPNFVENLISYVERHAVKFLIIYILEAHFREASVAHFEPMISHVAVWKLLHLSQWFAKTHHECSWRNFLTSFIH
jgi:hypothetical protein